MREAYAYETVLIVENHISEICEWRDRKIYESEIERDRDKDRMESRERVKKRKIAVCVCIDATENSWKIEKRWRIDRDDQTCRYMDR